MNPNQLTLVELQQKIRSKELSAKECAQASLKAIDERNSDLNAIVDTREASLQEAEQLDQRLKNGEDPGPLAGIPIVIKDNLAHIGSEVRGCSNILEGFKPTFNATAVQKLLDAGAIITGRANMDEFAMGSSNENSCYGPVKNPIDLERVPGGSSGGSAVAVAADFCAGSLGSDTGGSVRLPASFCGVVGLKPTWGRVSRYGLFAYASSLDQIGPLARTVEDAALLLQVIEGSDSKDATSLSLEAPLSLPEGKAEGLKIGLPKEFLETDKGLRPEIANRIKALADELSNAGAEVTETDLPILDHVISTYYLIANAEASSNLARYDSIRYGYRAPSPENLEASFVNSRSDGFGEEVQRRILVGTYALSSGYKNATYRKAHGLRQEMRKILNQRFESFDVLLGPTSTDVAFKIGEMDGDPVRMYQQDLFTTYANLVYAPAMSVPCGKVDGLPIGVHWVANRLNDAYLIRAGQLTEQLRQKEWDLA